MHTHKHQTPNFQALTYWRIGLKLLMIASISLITACAETTPYYDSKFGETTRATFNQQIINPEASNNTDLVKGIDGRAAHDAVQNYQKSFAEPEKSQGFNIGVGGSSSK